MAFNEAVGELRSFLTSLRETDERELRASVPYITWKQAQREVIFSHITDLRFQEVLFAMATPQEVALIQPKWGKGHTDHEKVWDRMKSCYPLFYLLSAWGRLKDQPVGDRDRLYQESLKALGLPPDIDLSAWGQTRGVLPLMECHPLYWDVTPQTWYTRLPTRMWLPVSNCEVYVGQEWKHHTYPVYTDGQMLKKARDEKNMKMVKSLMRLLG